MSHRRMCLAWIVVAFALAACSEEPTFQVGTYPGSPLEIDSPTRTLPAADGLTLLVDDGLGCVQATDSNGLTTACISMHQKSTALDFGMWRQGDDVIALVVSSEPEDLATLRQTIWYLSGDDGPSMVFDAVEVADHVYATALRSPIETPMWGVQFRTPDGRLTALQPLVGQFLNAPR